ncbi:Lrp/AsnC family transcriptional regulator [Candidatus Micrarchaeota archaeon]|nr:Lrp/AsnC family transcriptional regulator [Candidatus Micrarchaeota archaeon]
MKLDKKDKVLLNLLYLDSRMSFVEMGKKLRLSSSSVERRMKKLQEEGIVTLLFADVNLVKLGLKGYRLYFKFDVMDERTEKEVLKLFEAYPRTLWGVICEGEYDVLWRIVAKDELEVENAIALVLQKFGEKIVEKTVATTTYQTYLSWNKAFEAKRNPELPIEKIVEIEKLDETDMKILSALYSNARETTVNIARIVGLTPDAVQHRSRNLKSRGFILGYTAWYDARKLGFNYYKLLIGFRNVTKENEKEFVAYCTENDDVIFVNKTIGSWDIELDLIVKDNGELHKFTREIKTKFGHIIGKHYFISVVEERMLNPIREFI